MKLNLVKNYKTYDRYKDSGVEWLGEIPKDWNLHKLKNKFNFLNGFAFKSDNYQENGLPIIRIGDMGKRKINAQSLKRVPLEMKSQVSKFMVKENDILLALTGATIGKASIYNSKEEAYLNQRVADLRAKKDIVQKFLFYIVLSDLFKVNIHTNCFGGAQENIGKNEIGGMFFPFPDKQTQQKIADYLDEKTEIIDNIIKRKKKLIELLEEKKKTIVNKAVTKGLNDNVNKKNTIFGKVSVSWEVKSIGKISKFVKTGTTPSTNDEAYFEGELNWFTPGDFYSFELKESQRKLDEKALLDNQVKLFPANSVLLVSIGATLGKVAYCDKPFCCNQQVNVIYPNEKIHYKFIFYFLFFGKRLVNSYSTFTTLPILNQDRLEQIPILIPPFDEQQEIIDYLDKKTQDIDKIVEKINQSINLLTEYKSSLISHVVTGKVKV